MSKVSNSLKQKLYLRYKGAMVYIEVRLPNGDYGIGSGFHVGNGVVITAKHVVEGNQITSIGTAEDGYDYTDDELDDKDGRYIDFQVSRPQKLNITVGPFYHNSADVDLAAFVVDKSNFPFVPLGGHLDEWIQNDDFVLAQVLVMGFPPVPFNNEPTLVVATGEVNLVIDPYNASHPHFIISTMPRGGFSGGVCLIEWGFTLGIIVQSLVMNHAPTELGYMAVLSVEPIWICLRDHNILPDIQKEGWEGFWD